MQFELKLTLDGLMTLIAGLIAFVAVEHQILSERQAALNEEQRQNRSLATAIVFEIDSFYRFYVQDLPEGFSKKDPKVDKLIGMKSIARDPFPVYHGNADRLGGLEQETVSEVVQFYSFAKAYIQTISEYKVQCERWYAGDNPAVSEEIARFLWGQPKNALPQLIESALRSCQKLCQITEVEFQSPRIAIADANPLAKDHAQTHGH